MIKLIYNTPDTTLSEVFGVIRERADELSDRAVDIAIELCDNEDDKRIFWIMERIMALAKDDNEQAWCIFITGSILKMMENPSVLDHMIRSKYYKEIPDI